MGIEYSEKLTTKPHFSSGTNEAVFRQLRIDVFEVVNRLEPKRRWEPRFKAFLFPFLYLVLWLTAMFYGEENPYVYFALFLGLGFMIVLIFLNIVHDAVHGTIFRGRKLNDALVYLFDLVGANSFIWRLRHVRFHHNYPNVNGWDTDTEQSKILRIYPSGEFSRYHKYQHIYMPFIYPLFLFNWLLIRDFRDFFSKKKTVRKLVRIPPAEYVKLFIFKGFFFFYTIVFPVMLGISFGQALAGFVLMVFTASLFALTVLLPPHANTESEFPLPDEHNMLPQNWFMHMLVTTNDVKEDNWFIRFFLGSFNYHVAHHLFPNVNHVYYPEVTRKIEEYAQIHGLPYRKSPLLTALKNHFLLIKKNGTDNFDIWEESM